MKRKCILAAMILMLIGMAACTAGSTEDASGSGIAARTNADRDGNAETEIMKTQTVIPEAEAGKTSPDGTEAANTGIADGGEDSNDVENIECTLYAVIVESYENDIIAVRDQDTGIVIWFSTKDAEVIEGGSPIAVGDIVGLTYRGVQGDEEHPGTAVRVVPESMMYD